jgi:hypothetical protein
MKQCAIALCLLLAAQTLRARDDTTVDLYAGWSWMPFGTGYNGPCRYGYPSYWRFLPYTSLVLPLRGSQAPMTRPFYDYTGHALSHWDCEHSVRVRLNDAREFPATSDLLLPSLPPLPGDAPLDLRDPQREEAWTREIDAFLGSLAAPDWPAPAATNAPPQK